MKKVMIGILSVIIIGIIGMYFLEISKNINGNNAAIEKDIEVNNKKDQLYMLINALSDYSYYSDLKLGMEIVGQELGVRTECIGPAEYDMNAVISSFEYAITKKPNGILTVGFQPRLNNVIKKAIDAGIPVVTVDADLPNSSRLAYVGTNNFNAGKLGGEKLVEIINGHGKVGIAGRPEQMNQKERMDGYQEVFAKYPDIEVVQIVDTESNPVLAAKRIKELLNQYPDLVGLACVDEPGTSAALTAVTEVERVGKVKIVGMDRGNDILKGIDEGIISATIVQQTALMSYYGTQLLYNFNNSNIKITTDNEAAGVQKVPILIDTGVIIVDKDNCKYFMK